MAKKHNTFYFFHEVFAQKTNADMLIEQMCIEAELQKAVARSVKVRSRFEKLYEGNAKGKVAGEWFIQLSHKYKVERLELKDKVAEYREHLKKLTETTQDRDNFIHAVRKFMEIQT